MLSRRSLLKLGSLGIGLASSPSLQAQRGGPAAPSGALPPSIAALQSMANRARPFTNQERLARIEKARRLMAAEKIDAILLNGGSSPQYFANMSFGGGERLWALLIPAKGEPFVVCPAFDLITIITVEPIKSKGDVVNCSLDIPTFSFDGDRISNADSILKQIR